MVQTRDREKARADKLDQEKVAWRTKMDQVEADLKHALRMADSKESNLSKDMAMFNQEIARLTKERDTAKTELEVSRHDLARLEREMTAARSDADRLREEKDRMANGMEKGQREILESKENEIRKLTERVGGLERDLDKLRFEKEALEKEKEQLLKQANEARSVAVNSAAAEEEEKRRVAAEKKVGELTEQIRVLKAELSDKHKEYMAERQDLQRVIDEMRKGGTEAANAEVEKLRRDLEKAQKDVKEGDIERERFQAQLEMLVQELEKKQVGWQRWNREVIITSTVISSYYKIRRRTSEIPIIFGLAVFLKGVQGPQPGSAPSKTRKLPLLTNNSLPCCPYIIDLV
jgi:chromosome segregation ATPase